MLGGIFYDGDDAVNWPHRDTSLQSTSDAQSNVMAHLRDLTREMERLKLLNQALWELLRARFDLNDADLEAVIHQVDMRDGVEDGRMTTTALKCPSCGRVSSSKHWKCLYCGQAFEKPVLG